MSGRRSSSFLIHKCNIERSQLIADVSNIRDRRIERWNVLYSNVRCWFEHQNSSIIDGDQFGRVPVERYNVWFEGNASILPNDRLNKGGTYYIVEGVLDFSSEDWHKMAQVRKMNYRQS